MPCQFCRQKIPFFRSWFSVAKFCCDEHEREYKQISLDRLVTATISAPVAPKARPLPLPETPPEPEAPASSPEEPSVIATAGPEPEAPADVRNSLSDEAVEELWRLADKVAAKGSAASPALEAAADSPTTPRRGRRKRKGRRRA